MLLFNIDEKGNYKITEKILSFNDTKQMIILYKKDLSKKKVNKENWKNTTQEDIDWFKKHYIHKF